MLVRNLALALLITVPTLLRAEPVHAEVLRVTADPSCPYVCPDPQTPTTLAQQPGIIFEILDAILGPAGIQIRVEFLPYSRSLRSVQLGEHDAMLVTLKDDAPSLYYHQTPIALAKGCFVTRSDNAWQYRGISSLEQIRFGGTLGYKYGPLKAFIERSNPNKLMMSGEETFDRLLYMVEIGRLDATIEDINVIDYRLKQLQLTHKLHLAGCLPPMIPLYVGISPHYPTKERLSNAIDQGLDDLKRSGQLHRIMQKYGFYVER
ncbi:MAG: transporter substrate-binding domain-containing protein [Halopseudomonas sp.]